MHDNAYIMNRDGQIWLDGEWLPWADAKIHVMTHTLHYGMGAFEGLRAYEGEAGTAIFRLKEHVDRLFRSAHILNMKLPFAHADLVSVCAEAVRKNGLRQGYIRPMCFYGAEDAGLRADKLKTHVMVAAWEWDTYLGKEGLRKGIRVKTSSYTRHHVNISLCKAKANGHYINSMLALQEAVACGCEEALLLDNEGYVAEGSGENIFLVRDGRLLTPDLTSALEGITRDSIIRLAAERDIPVVEKRITRDEVYVADEAFFTGTAAEVTPIRELDGRRVGSGEPGPITLRLQQDYFDCVHGRHSAHSDWLHHV